MLTSSPPQPSATVDIAPHDIRDPSVASPLRHTKPVAHALTQKTYIANQNEICSKPTQEDIADGSISSTPGPYFDNHATLPTFHSQLNQTNLTLS
jgi:hypothetical protein